MSRFVAGIDPALPLSMLKELHCYEYVNRPFEDIRDALINDAVGVFERATQTATSRARALVSSLKVEVAGLEIGKNVVIKVTAVEPKVGQTRLASDAVKLELEWHAESNTSLFPAMHATLLAYPLSSSETQLDLLGRYEPPGGIFGSAADMLLGHRIAAATVHRFLDEVATRLKEELA